MDAAVPDEIKRAMSSMVTEIAFAVAGEPFPVDTADPTETFVVLGEDRAGNQVSARDGFRPILVFLILMMEMFVMASLIAKEIQDRTVTAMLVTPATVGDVLAAKGITGTLSGPAQAIIVLTAIDSLSPNPLLGPTVFYVFPDWPQWIAKLFPTYWVVNPVYEVTVNGAGLDVVWVELAIAVGIIAAMVAPILLLSRRLETSLGMAS